MGLNISEFGEECSFSLKFEINILILVLYCVSASLFVVLSVLHFKKSNALHPFFSITYSIVLIFYILCNLSAATYIILLLQGSHNVDLLNTIDFLYFIFYAVISPQIVIALVERGLATIYANSYERSRPWLIYLLAQCCGVSQVFTACRALAIWDRAILKVGIVVLNTYLNLKGQLITSFLEGIILVTEGYATEFIQIAVSITVSFCMLGLILVNRRLTANSLGKRSLQARYQFTENVRALRLLIIFAVFDTIISVDDCIGTILFEIETTFEREKCSQPGYVWEFVVFKAISFLFEYMTPLSIIYQYHVFKADRESSKPRRVSAYKDKENHFEMLQQQWGVKPMKTLGIIKTFK